MKLKLHFGPPREATTSLVRQGIVLLPSWRAGPLRSGVAITRKRRVSTGKLLNCYKMFDSKRKGVNLLSTKTLMYVSWVTAVTAILAAISFIMLALLLHHSTRSAVGHTNLG